MTMLLNALHRLPAAAAATSSAASRLSGSAVSGRIPIGLLTTITDSTRTNQQQTRYRWTKAKKKRFARYERRQQLEEEGKSFTKPPYYFPKDTAVLNVRSKYDLANESRKFDQHAAEEMRSKLRVQQQQPVLRHHMTNELRMSDRVRRLLNLHNGSQMEVVKAQKQQGMELFQMRGGDTGSSAVQVIALTTRIQQLQTHLNRHHKDRHSKRGLDALYVRRRKLLDYMERKDFDSYQKVVKTLGLVR